jgi:hypothetical protein
MFEAAMWMTPLLFSSVTTVPAGITIRQDLSTTMSSEVTVTTGNASGAAARIPNVTTTVASMIESSMNLLDTRLSLIPVAQRRRDNKRIPVKR